MIIRHDRLDMFGLRGPNELRSFYDLARQDRRDRAEASRGRRLPVRHDTTEAHSP
jgi:hypothetical protein